jgi:class 3 adenylate cyclase/tetratricopeptide (TPR) repeat protein
MQCPGCQHENREGRRFCAECGTSLALACASCGFSNEPGEKFCGGCGAPLGAPAATASGSRFNSPESYTPKHLAEKILTSKAALEGERKQVTVLFADLKGSMELLADRDPEEARKILDAVLERMMEAVHRYEGTVNQVMGDGIMALFGAPLAHEDHAVRACYAALRMQEAVKRYAEEARRAHGVNVQIRVGLNSGDVVVRAIGSDLRMDYTAVGQTTHLAARMEQLALPGTIVVTPSTLTLIEGLVAVTSLGPVPVKGLAEPLEVFEVTGVGDARTRLHAAARRGLTRFVGRDGELEQLWRAQDLAAKGRGQVVAVVGEAGVGKSRLTYEFTHSHRLQGWLVLEAASVSYGKATSYLPVIALLKSYFKIQDRDDHREIQEKVTGKLLALDRSLEPLLPAILSLLDVPVQDPDWLAMVPAQRRRQTLDGVKRLLLREAREQPVAVIFEDLHWIDSETQALLDDLVEGLSSARLLLFVNYRPEYQHSWAGKTYYSQHRLDALSPETTADLLDALLGDDPSLAPLKQLLVKRGNPFFVEETVRTLLETKVLAGERGRFRLVQPIGTIQIPPTVQTILAARIDRLTPEAKHLLQVASVVGKGVPFTLLREIAEEPDEHLRTLLVHLQTAEFLHETALFPDLEYSFKHALTHEVTYSSLLHERRRALHARIVEAIERLYQDRLAEHIERLAHHAVVGELGERAVDYVRQAGLKATGRSAIHDARVWFERALDVLSRLPETRSTLEKAVDIRLEQRTVLIQLDEFRQMLEHLREAERIAEGLNDEGRQARVWAFLAWSYRQDGELDHALAVGTRALDIAGRREDLDLRLYAASGLVETHFFRGDFSRAVKLAHDILATLPADWTFRSMGGTPMPTSVFTRVNLTRCLTLLGRFGEAAACEVETTRLAERTQHAFTIGFAHYGATLLYLAKGDWAPAHSRVERWLALHRATGIKHWFPVAVASSALVRAQLGERDEATKRLGEAEELVEEGAARGNLFNSAHAFDLLGHACLRLGRTEDAQRFARRALEASEVRPLFTPRVLWLLADIASHPDRFDPEDGETRYGKAMAAAEAQEQRPVLAHCHLGLGKLFSRVGKRQAAAEHLTIAATMYRDMEMRFWLGETEVLMRESS